MHKCVFQHCLFKVRMNPFLRVQIHKKHTYFFPYGFIDITFPRHLCSQNSCSDSYFLGSQLHYPFSAFDHHSFALCMSFSWCLFWWSLSLDGFLYFFPHCASGLSCFHFSCVYSFVTKSFHCLIDVQSSSCFLSGCPEGSL